MALRASRAIRSGRREPPPVPTAGVPARARPAGLAVLAVLTAVAGDLTTRAGIASGSQDAFLAIAIGLVALLVPTFLLPAHDPAHAAPGHGHGH
jgi:hypothetical protein